MGWRPNYQRATSIRLAILRVIIGWSAPQTRREKPTYVGRASAQNLLTLPRGCVAHRRCARTIRVRFGISILLRRHHAGE